MGSEMHSGQAGDAVSATRDSHDAPPGDLELGGRSISAKSGGGGGGESVERAWSGVGNAATGRNDGEDKEVPPSHPSPSPSSLTSSLVPPSLLHHQTPPPPFHPTSVSSPLPRSGC